MRTSSILRAISLKFQTRGSPALVTPWPVQSEFDSQLVEEIGALRCGSSCSDESYTSTKWLRQVLDTAVATLSMAIESLGDISCEGEDRKVIEEHLDDTVELLDACNSLRERMENVQKYVDSMRIVLHCLEGRAEPNATMLAKTRVVLESCEAMERRCSNLEKCNSNLRKLGEKLAQRRAKSEKNICDTPLQEVINGSKAMTLFACGVLGISLSFKSKRGLPSIQSHQTRSWSTSLQELHKEVKDEIEKQRKSGNVVLAELREVVNAAKNLRDLINVQTSENSPLGRVEMRDVIMCLRRSCGELDEGMKPLEGKVNELYRNLISIRMALLGAISQAKNDKSLVITKACIIS